MKKSRRLLSVVLAILLAFASMPIVYTAAAEPVLSAGASGTLDNPTKPVLAEGEYNREDLFKMNYGISSTTYHFYQTVDNEYFAYTQSLGLQQYNSDAANRELWFNSIADYTGGSNVNGNADGVQIGLQGYYETPVITKNDTSTFISENRVSEEWMATNENAKETVQNNTDKKPVEFKLDGGLFDWGGCKVYTWNSDVVFQGADKGESTPVSTIYKQLNWLWKDTETLTTQAQMDFRYGTVIDVVDARQLKKELVKAENIIANPENYTQAYVSSVEATYNSIPDDLKDFSAYYTQEQVNAFAQSLKDVSLNSADYTTYNNYYRELKKLDNHTGSWTDDSFKIFQAEIAAIDSGLPKNLDKTQQATVDAATQALIAAYDKLVATDVSDETEGNDYSYTSNGDDGDMSFAVDDTTFKFMQTKDDQVFEYSQLWEIKRDGGNTARAFKGMILETAYPLTEDSSKSTCYSAPTLTENKTQEFINLLTDDSKTTITADNEYQSVTATEFKCWWEEDANGVSNETSTFVDEAGTLDSNRDFEYSNGKTYYLRNTPKIKGNPAGTYGSIAVNYVLRTGWTYKTGGFLGMGATKHAAHIHINNTVEITDVRQLINAVDNAEAIFAKPAGYSDGFVEALSAAVGSVPAYMLSGNEFYTQAEVDKYTLEITNLLNNPQANYADYSEFNEVFEEMSAVENEGKYTPSSYETFQEEIYEINKNLKKDLTSDQQATVDAAADALYAAKDKLTYRHLNEDESFSNIDISDSLGNSSVSFNVSSTNYNFMQIADGQKFVIKTDLSLKNTKSSYKSKLLSLKISQLDGDPNSANYYNNLCPNRGSETDTGCHYGDQVLRNDYATLLGSITSGINRFDTANAAGDIAEFNTWVNNYGVALSSNGIISDGVQLSNEESSASAIMTYTGATGGAESLTSVNLQYALRLGWSYQEVVLGVEGDSTSRHAHIPVTLNITDARALNSLYEEAVNAVTGKTDKTYTLKTLEDLYAALITIPTDMVNGDVYYSQEEVNDEYNKLKSAFDSLKEGADYSEYFQEQVKAQEIISSKNTDSYNNKLYTDEAYKEYTETVEEIINGLDKNLDATDENQATIDSATQALKDAEAKLNENKLADYEKFSEALEKANDILSAPEGTYTDETIQAVQNAVDNANAVSKDLPASEQTTVDAATDALTSAVEDALYRADYSEYEEAKKLAESIKNDDGTYTNSAYTAYLEKIAQIDASLDKNLPDYAVNRQTIAEATQALKDAMTELNNNKKGDYSAFEAELEKANSIVNDDGTGNTIYSPEAFEAYKNAVSNIDASLNRDLTEHEQATIDSATQALKDAQSTLEDNKWADYSELEANKALVQEILDAPEGTYTDSTVQAAQQAMDAANSIPAGLVVGKDDVYQNQIDNAADALKNVYDSKLEKADYSQLESAMQDSKLQEILNAPEGTYTESTVQAVKDALAAAQELNKDLPKSDQGTVDNVANALQNAVDNIQIKADYSDFDAVKDQLEDIVNAPEGTYTDSTVQAAQDALDVANGVDKDLPQSQQPAIDSATDAMQNVLDNAQEKADYTDYNNVKSEIEDIINNGNIDENGEKIYDDAVYEELKNIFTTVDTSLDKDLPDSQQSVVDTATNTLEEAKTKLENSKIYTITFVAEDGTTINSIDYTNGTLLKNIEGKPELPVGTEVFAYVGWATAENVLYTEDTAVTGDVTVSPAGEFVKIAPIQDSTLKLDEIADYITGIDKNTTVSVIKAQLENDLTYIEIKDYTGAELADEALVGSGSTITLKSKYTGEIYETKTIIVYGDVDGDGDVDNDDYTIAIYVNVGDAFEEYTIDGVYREYFFIANDLNGDGFIDVLDSSLLALVKNGKRTIV